MTITNRSFAEISDLLGLGLICKGCDSLASLNIGQFKNIPEYCPNCKTKWYPDQSANSTALHGLITAIENVKKIVGNEPCKIVFEVKSSL